MRVMSSRLPTSRLSRSASSRAFSTRLRRVASSNSMSSSCKLLKAPVIETSGVRRSCEIELSSAVAAFQWLAAPQLSGLLCQLCPLDGKRCLADKGFEQPVLIGVKCRSGSDGFTPNTPTTPRAVLSGM